MTGPKAGHPGAKLTVSFLATKQVYLYLNTGMPSWKESVDHLGVGLLSCGTLVLLSVEFARQSRHFRTWMILQHPLQLALFGNRDRTYLSATRRPEMKAR